MGHSDAEAAEVTESEHGLRSGLCSSIDTSGNELSGSEVPSFGKLSIGSTSNASSGRVEQAASGQDPVPAQDGDVAVAAKTETAKVEAPLASAAASDQAPHLSEKIAEDAQKPAKQDKMQETPEDTTRRKGRKGRQRKRLCPQPPWKKRSWGRIRRRPGSTTWQS